MLTEPLECQVLGFLQSQRQEGLSLHKEVETLFMSGLAFLKSQFPNPSVSRLAGVSWDVLGFGITPLCIDIPVRALTFLVAGTVEAPEAKIVAPKSWDRLVRRDPITQLGALVFVCSQAVDYCHDRLAIDPSNIRLRAHAYEAEYLNTIRQLSPTWELNDYHLQVLQEYPDGLATPKANRLIYGIPSFVAA